MLFQLEKSSQVAKCAHPTGKGPVKNFSDVSYSDLYTEAPTQEFLTIEHLDQKI